MPPSPGSSSSRARACALACMLCACSEGVQLGSECPASLGCVSDAGLDGAPTRDDASTGEAPPGEDDAAVPGAPDGGEPSNDAAAPIDTPDGASGDASVDLFENPSFELSSGSSAGALTPLPPGTGMLGANFNAVRPWLPCTGGFEALNRLSIDGQPDILPSDGEAFVSAPIGLLGTPGTPIGLGYEFQGALTTGTTYQFMIDLRSTSPSANVWLTVRGATTGVGCIGTGSVLFTSEHVDSSAWISTCVTFTQSGELSGILLSGSADANALDQALLFDNIRAEPGCGAPPAP